jgi:hypothetical protein
LLFLFVSSIPYLFWRPRLLSRYSDSLRTGRLGDRISVRSETFRTRPDRSWSQHYLPFGVYQVSFPVLKRPGPGVDHPSPSGADMNERVALFLYLLSEPSRPVRVSFTFTSTYSCLFQCISLLQPVLHHFTSSQAVQHKHLKHYNIYQTTVLWVITLPKIILLFRRFGRASFLHSHCKLRCPVAYS